MMARAEFRLACVACHGGRIISCDETRGRSRCNLAEEDEEKEKIVDAGTLSRARVSLPGEDDDDDGDVERDDKKAEVGHGGKTTTTTTTS